MNDNTLIDAVSAVMRLHEMQARVAASNLAMANVPDARLSRFDASAQMQAFRAALHSPSAMKTEITRMQSMDAADYMQPLAATERLSPDALVAEMSAASGRYQALAEGLSRQFALMRLAIGGGK